LTVRDGEPSIGRVYLVSLWASDLDLWPFDLKP